VLTHLHPKKRGADNDKADERPNKKQKVEPPSDTKNTSSKKSTPSPRNSSAQSQISPVGATVTTAQSPPVPTMINPDVSSPSFPIMGIAVQRSTPVPQGVSPGVKMNLAGLTPQNFLYQQYFFPQLKQNPPQQQHFATIPIPMPARTTAKAPVIQKPRQ